MGKPWGRPWGVERAHLTEVIRGSNHAGSETRRTQLSVTVRLVMISAAQRS